MNEDGLTLQFAPILLSYLMQSNPRLQLVNAIAWLDPTSLLNERNSAQAAYEDYDEDDTLTVALHICRDCFPAVYAGAVQLQWQGADERRIERYLLDGLGTYLEVPPGSLDELRYGPPLDFCGVSLYAEPEDFDGPLYNRLLPIFAHFGVTPDNHEAPDLEAIAVVAAKVLVISLRDHAEQDYQDLVYLLQWLFAFSGNTAVDYTADEFWEGGFDPAGWIPHDIQLINDINRESREVITSAFRALTQLETNSAFQRLFTRNVKAVLRAVQKHVQKKGSSIPHAYRRLFSLSDADTAALARAAHWPDRPERGS